MCGIPRPSTGHRIAIMFPHPQPQFQKPQVLLHPYSLSFRETDTQTKAVFRIKDTETYDVFRACHGIDLRIERHGDLSSPVSLAKTTPPLYQFRLRPSKSSCLTYAGRDAGADAEMEFELPERLDLGVSERGIVGRQVTVTVTVGSGDVMGVGMAQGVGMGIVGFD